MDGEQRHSQRIQGAVESDVAIYFNGFTIGIGNGDIVFALERNGKPVAALNASYTVAKTLAQKLGRIMAQLEEASGNRIMSTDEVGDALSKIQKVKEPPAEKTPEAPKRRLAVRKRSDNDKPD